MRYIIEHWTEIAGVFSIIGMPLSFLFGRKMKLAETRIKETDAIKSMQGAYDGWVADDKERYSEMKEEVLEMKKELGLQRKESYQQREENRSLRKAVEALEKRELEWKQKNIELEKKYNSLRVAFDRLKKKYDDKVNQTSSDGGGG